MLSTTSAASAAPRCPSPIRVMVVDDSAVVRGLISRWLDAEDGIEVVSSQRTGRAAVQAVVSSAPDVIVLDIEMPEMDGLTALPILLERCPGVVVIMASTLTRRNAEISLKALSLGARDYIAKPETSGLSGAQAFREDLVGRVRALAPKRRRPVPDSVRSPVPAVTRHEPDEAIALVPASSVRPRVLAIGSSTGGPPALMRVLKDLVPTLDTLPVLVVQHMPPMFTAILAEHLARATGIPVAEAVDGEPARPGRIYIAPGGRHMTVLKGDTPVIRLDDGPQVNFCKPAVDPLFDSVAGAFGAASLALVLTGMGHDGRNGARSVVAAGGTVVAQDKPSSVVWGMPGAVARAGLCAQVLPLEQIGGRIACFIRGERA